MDKWSIFLIFLVRKRRSSEHKMAGFAWDRQAYRGVKPLQIAFHTQCASFVPRRRFDVVITGDQIWNYLLKSDAKPSRTHIMSLKPDKPFGPSRNTAHTLFDSLLRASCNVHSPSSPNVVRINTALAWRSERFRLARRFQYAVQEGKLN